MQVAKYYKNTPTLVDQRETPLRVNANGELIVAGSMTVTATNLEIANDVGNPIPMSSVDLGVKADSVATTDTGTFSLIALFKRALQKLTSLISTQNITLVTTQSVVVSGTSAQSSVVNASTTRVILSSTTDCWVQIGSNPTAQVHVTGAGFFLVAGASTYPITVTGGTDKIAVIQDSGAGYLSIIEIL